MKNRSRLSRGVIKDAREESKGAKAISWHLSLHKSGTFGLTKAALRDCIKMHGDFPDIRDLAHRTWEACAGTSRFKPEGAQKDLVRGIKALTSKHLVGVGCFASADAMVRQIRTGVLDFIGAARPSIADPFLPKKIEEGRFDDTRECNGCNSCVSGDMTGAISRCTRSTAFRKGWRQGLASRTQPPEGGVAGDPDCGRGA